MSSPRRTACRPRMDMARITTTGKQTDSPTTRRTIINSRVLPYESNKVHVHLGSSVQQQPVIQLYLCPSGQVTSSHCPSFTRSSSTPPHPPECVYLHYWYLSNSKCKPPATTTTASFTFFRIKSNCNFKYTQVYIELKCLPRTLGC